MRRDAKRGTSRIVRHRWPEHLVGTSLQDRLGGVVAPCVVCSNALAVRRCCKFVCRDGVAQLLGMQSAGAVLSSGWRGSGSCHVAWQCTAQQASSRDSQEVYTARHSRFDKHKQFHVPWQRAKDAQDVNRARTTAIGQHVVLKGRVSAVVLCTHAAKSA